MPIPKITPTGTAISLLYADLNPSPLVLQGHTVRANRPVVPAQLLANKAKSTRDACDPYTDDAFLF